MKPNITKENLAKSAKFRGENSFHKSRFTVKKESKFVKKRGEKSPITVNQKFKEPGVTVGIDPYLDWIEPSYYYGNGSNVKSKEENKFKVGDTLKAVPWAPYSITAGEVIMRVTEVISSSTIFVNILDSSGEPTHGRHAVRSEYFEAIGNYEEYLKRQNALKITVANFSEQEIAYVFESNGVALKFVNGLGELSEIHVGLLSLKQSAISCGIKECEGLNKLFNLDIFLPKITRFLTDPENYTEELHDNICRYIIHCIIHNYVSAGFLLFSTNDTDNSQFDRISSVMDELPYTTHRDTYNRNSNHNIRLWIVDTYKIQT